MKFWIAVATLLLLAGHARADNTPCSGPDGEALDACRMEEAFEAAKANPTDARLNEVAAHRGIGMYKHYGQDQCEQDHPACMGYGSILLDSARCFDRAEWVAKGIAVRRLLVNKAPKLGETFHARTALRELGELYEQIGVYDRAAEHHFRYAEAAVERADAETAYARGVELLFLLGTTEAAAERALKYAVRYPDSSAIADHRVRHLRALIREQRWKKARAVSKLVAASQKKHKRRPTVAELALLSQVQRASGDEQGATRSVGKISKRLSENRIAMASDTRRDLARAFIAQAHASDDAALMVRAGRIGKSRWWRVRGQRLAGDLHHAASRSGSPKERSQRTEAARSAYRRCLAIAKRTNVWSPDALACARAVGTKIVRGRWRGPAPLWGTRLLAPVMHKIDGSPEDP